MILDSADLVVAKKGQSVETVAEATNTRICGGYSYRPYGHGIDRRYDSYPKTTVPDRPRAPIRVDFAAPRDPGLAGGPAESLKRLHM